MQEGVRSGTQRVRTSPALFVCTFGGLGEFAAEDGWAAAAGGPCLSGCPAQGPLVLAHPHRTRPPPGTPSVGPGAMWILKIAALRAQGASWREITARLGVASERFTEWRGDTQKSFRRLLL